MHFKFIPLFLNFFNKFNYLPPSISFKKIKFSPELTQVYFFKLFTRCGENFNVKSLLLKTMRSIWLITKLQTSGNVNLGIFSKNTVLFFSLMQDISELFNKFKYLFFFFFSKLNKRIYKFSNYKRPRYSIKYQYIPKFKRMKSLLKFMSKSVIHFKGASFKERFSSLIISILFATKSLFFLKYTLRLQYYIFKEKKFMLLL
jgi:hypothetical protein